MVSISIPVDNHGTGCVDYYKVEYQLVGEPGWTPTENQFTSPIVLNNIPSNEQVMVRITRFCCDNGFSNPIVTGPINTTTEMPAPTGFTATPYIGPEVQLVWDNNPIADTYIIERATNSGFTVGLTEVYNGVYTSFYLDTAGLSSATTYWYRIRSTKAGFPDSGYATLNVTTL